MIHLSVRMVRKMSLSVMTAVMSLTRPAAMTHLMAAAALEQTMLIIAVQQRISRLIWVRDMRQVLITAPIN